MKDEPKALWNRGIRITPQIAMLYRGLGACGFNFANPCDYSHRNLKLMSVGLEMPIIVRQQAKNAASIMYSLLATDHHEAMLQHASALFVSGRCTCAAVSWLSYRKIEHKMDAFQMNMLLQKKKTDARG